MKKKEGKKKYSIEFKLSVILDMIENDLSLRKVTRKYFGAKNRKEEEAHKDQPRKWLKLYYKYGIEGLYPKTGERTMKKANDNESMRIEKLKEELLEPILETDTPEEKYRKLQQHYKFAQMEIDILKKKIALRQERQQKKTK